MIGYVIAGAAGLVVGYVIGEKFTVAVVKDELANIEVAAEKEVAAVIARVKAVLGIK